jgi:hypothetical protein
MKIRRRYLIAGIIGLALIAVVGSGLVASAFAGKFCDWGPPMGRHGGWFHGGTLPDEFAERVLARIDGRVADLQLTEQQNAKYQELRLRLKGRMEAQFNEQKALKEQIRAEVNRDKPNPQAVNDLVKRRIRMLSQGLEEGSDLFAEFYGLLDENQKGKVLARLRERMEHGPGWK